MTRHHGGDRNVSAVQNDIILALGLNAQPRPTIKLIGNVHLGRALSYVAGADEINNPSWATNRFLNVPETDLDAIMPAGFPETIYEASCGGILDGAIRANAGFSFPIAALNAALAASYNSTGTTTIQMANGRFTSPLWNMWMASDDTPNAAQQRLFASMILWGWYAVPRPGTDRIVTEFTGTFMYRQASNRTNSRLAGSSGARLTLPFFSTSGTGRAEINVENRFTTSNPEIFFAAQPNGAPFITEPMPTAAEIAAKVLSLGDLATITPETDTTVPPGEARSFFARVTGLPSSYCGPGWEVFDQPTGETASLVLGLAESPQRIVEGNSASCRFKMTYRPGRNAAASANLTVYLTTAARAGTRLRLRLGQIRFSTTPPPVLRPISFGRLTLEAITGSDQQVFNLKWGPEFRLIDSNRFRQIDRIDTSDVTMDCAVGTVSGTPPVFRPTFNGTGSDSFIGLRLDGQAEYHGRLDPAAFDRVSCPLTGNVRFLPAGGGDPINLQMPAGVMLDYPRPRVASAAAVPPAQAPGAAPAPQTPARPAGTTGPGAPAGTPPGPGLSP